MWVRVPAVMLLALLAGAEQRQPGQGLNWYSTEKEAALGTALAAQARKDNRIINNAAAHAYLEQLGRRLAAQLPRSTFACTFEIIADDTDQAGTQTHEPLVLPGGYIFVSRALFLAAADETEFAGMLAHAMAHVAERHYTRTATRKELADRMDMPVIFIGVAPGAAAPLGFAKFRRAYEREADSLAVQVMARAGYDPEALARYIERTQIDATGAVSRMSSPMPPRESRVDTILRAIRLLPAHTYSSTPEFRRIQESLR